MSRDVADRDQEATCAGARWVGVNTVTVVKPKVRCRLVAHEFASKEQRQAFFFVLFLRELRHSRCNEASRVTGSLERIEEKQGREAEGPRY